MAILIFLVAHWYLSLFGQTFFLHRYAAHKMFHMSKFWEKFFFIFTWFMQGTSYLSAKGYSILHRMHHTYSDTAKDPHTPHHANNVFDMMWKTKQYYSDYNYDDKPTEERFTRDIPEWKAIDDLGDSWGSRVGFMILYTSFYVVFATEWWQFLFLPLHFMMGPLQGAVVNWCGHMYGYRNFESSDKSTNTLPWDLFLLGELYQNNHHHKPMDINFAQKWFEIDPTRPVTWLLQLFGIIKPVRA
jgi:stearoyl-CoA desaturase (Delta-9 desaturase)